MRTWMLVALVAWGLQPMRPAWQPRPFQPLGRPGWVQPMVPAWRGGAVPVWVVPEGRGIPRGPWGEPILPGPVWPGGGWDE